MSEQLFNQFADIPALEKQLEQINKIFSDVKMGIGDLSKVGIKIEGATGIKELNAATKEYDSIVKTVIERKAAYNGHTKELTDLILKESKAVKESSAAKLNDAKAEVEVAKAKKETTVAKLNDTKAEVENAKAIKEANKATEARLKADLAELRLREQIRKESEKSAEALRKSNAELKAKPVASTVAAPTQLSTKDAALLTNDYAQLSKAYNEAALKAKNYALQLGQNHPVTEQAIKDAKGMYDILLKVDQAVGQNQRNVGNYKSAFDGLSFSFTQVARELPSLAISPQQFFLAISNNLPMVTDEIAKAKAEIKALQAEGKAAPSLFSRLSSSILSFNVFLSIGITLLTVYGKEIGEFVKGIFSSKSEMEKLADQAKRLNDIIAESKDEYVKAVTEVNNLKIAFRQAREGIITKEEALKLYNDTIGKTTGEVQNLDEAEKALAKNAEAYIQFTLLKAAAQLALSKAAEKAFEAELTRAKKTEEFLSIGDKFTSFAVGSSSAPGGFVPGQKSPSQLAQDKAEFEKIQGEKRKQQALKIANEEKDGLLNIQKDLLKQAEEISKNFNFDFNAIKEPASKSIGGAKKTKAEKTKEENDFEFELIKLHLNRLIEKYGEIAANEDNTYEYRLRALAEYIKARNDLNEFQFNSESKGKKGKELEVLEAQKYDRLLDIQKEFQKRVDDINKDREESEKILYGTTYKIAKQAAEDLAKLEKEQREKYIKDEKEFAKKKKDLYRELYKEIQETIFAFLDDSAQKEDDALARKLTLLERETEARKTTINASGLNEVERTRQLAAVEKQAAFEREKIEERRRQIAQQRARYEKAQSIATIIQSTAEAVIAALGSKPYTPANIALAALTGTIGAVQLARAISTPIPQYFKGTDNAKPGVSMVGELGSELMLKDGKVSLTPAVPTLMNLSGGEKIIPADVTKDILNAVNMRHLIGLKHFSDIPMSEQRINQHLQEKMLSTLQSIDSKSRIIINNQMGIESSAYYQNNMKN